MTLSVGDLSDMASAFTPGDEPENNLYEIRIETQRDGGKWTKKPVVVWLWYEDDGHSWRLVGVEHID